MSPTTWLFACLAVGPIVAFALIGLWTFGGQTTVLRGKVAMRRASEATARR